MFEIDDQERAIAANAIEKAYPLEQRLPDSLAALMDELRRVEAAEKRD